VLDVRTGVKHVAIELVADNVLSVHLKIRACAHIQKEAEAGRPENSHVNVASNG
jgi:hypothetical protein